MLSLTCLYQIQANFEANSGKARVSPPPGPFQRASRDGSFTGGLQVSLSFCSFDDIHPQIFIIPGRVKEINYDLKLLQAYQELCKIPAVSQITLLEPQAGNFMEMTLRQRYTAQQGAFYTRHLSSTRISSFPPLGPAQLSLSQNLWGLHSQTPCFLQTERPLPWPASHCPFLGDFIRTLSKDQGCSLVRLGVCDLKEIQEKLSRLRRSQQNLGHETTTLTAPVGHIVRFWLPQRIHLPNPRSLLLESCSCFTTLFLIPIIG